MLRTLIYFRRMNLAVIAGVAVTTAVLTGALMVGDSLQGSLRELTLDRLGRTEQAVLNNQFFPADLAQRLASQPALASQDLDLVPTFLLRGSAVHPESQRRAASIQVLGIDPSFVSLYPDSPSATELAFAQRSGQIFPSVVLNESLKEELGAQLGDDVLLSFGRPATVPTASLMGRREDHDLITTLRLTVTGVIPASGPGGFGLEARQTRPLSAFVELATLQRRLDKAGQINLLLVGRDTRHSGSDSSTISLAEELVEVLELRDLGLRLSQGPEFVALESSELILRPGIVDSALLLAGTADAKAWPYLTYLANRMEIGDRLLPYSTVTAIDLPVPRSLGEFKTHSGTPFEELGRGQIALNSWAAEDLAAEPGDQLKLTSYLIGQDDQLLTDTSIFEVATIVEMESLASDPTLTPDVPGISDTQDIASWDPPFTVDLDLVRPADEAYWDEYRGTPKAFVTLREGQDLWRSRYGELTAIRLVPSKSSSPQELYQKLNTELPRILPPEQSGFSILPVLQQGLEGASGTTDFAGLFLGFSLFLIVAAALLSGLLFTLLVEQRSREAGLLQATGFTVAQVQRRFILEGGVLASVGTLLGTGLALAYSHFVLLGLTAWWSPVLDSPVLAVHVVPLTLVAGLLSSLILTVLVITWTVRRITKEPARQLLAKQAGITRQDKRSKRASWTALIAFCVSLVLIGISWAAGMESAPALFFGVGSSLLVGGVAAFASWASGSSHKEGLSTHLVIPTLAMRNSSRNLGRSLLSVTLVASASFVLVSVSASRKTHGRESHRHDSGTGGFSLVAESNVPLPTKLDRELQPSPDEIYSFRVLPGDDASCLNLYQPQQPRLLGVPGDFVDRGGFRFRSQSQPTDNPWSLLDESLESGVIPAIGDYNSVRWILHSGLGQDLVLEADSGQEVRLRIVALLDASLFQSELLVSQEAFLRYFPNHDGYGFFLGDFDGEQLAAGVEALESQWSSHGLDAGSAVARLAGFQAVENMYLTTFEVLGGLGLLLGTLGLGVVLWRNTLERQGELAVLRAFGYRRSTLAWMVIAENAFLLLVGLAIGSFAGLIAVSPHLLTGGIEVPWSSLIGILAAVFAAGLLASGAAVLGTLKVPLLPALKAD